jgi:hypothetical protein
MIESGSLIDYLMKLHGAPESYLILVNDSFGETSLIDYP